MRFLTEFISNLSSKIKKKRVIFIQQTRLVECGTACFAMILNYHGWKASLSEANEYCKAGKSGTSALALVKAGRGCGFLVKAYYSDLANISNIPLPAIAHWAANHYVVIEEVTKEKILIVDPAAGKRKLSYEDFEKLFSNIVITYVPTEEFSPLKKESDGSSGTKYFVDLIKTEKFGKLLSLIILCSFLITLTEIFALFIIKRIFESNMSAETISPTNIIVAVTLLICVLYSGLLFSRTKLLARFKKEVNLNVTKRFFKNLLDASLLFFQSRKNSELLQKLNNLDYVTEFVVSQLISVISRALFLCISLPILLFFSLESSLVVVLTGIIQAFLLYFSYPKLANLTGQTLNAKSLERDFIFETLKSMPSIKTGGSENAFNNYWEKIIEGQSNIALEKNNADNLLKTAIYFLCLVSSLLILGINIKYINYAQNSFGEFVFVTVLGGFMIFAIAKLLIVIKEFQITSAHLVRVTDVLKQKPLISDGLISPEIKGDVELKNVTFQYNKEDLFALQNISLSVKAGQKAAIVGKASSGKSTLVNLLAGIYESYEGEILYDGINIKSIDNGSLRKTVGVVLQDVNIFDGSILDNICMFDFSVSQEDIIRSAQLSGLHDDIIRLSLGYQTIIGNEGLTLPAEQQQKLAITRALIHNPSILIFDEATAALDTDTETGIDKNLQNHGCTRIVISNRLSAVYNSDVIFVINQGCLIESGVHEELIQSSETYKSLILSSVGAPSPDEPKF
jgi:ABC-type bacteriocin/lantibiotic exporter with double-glycine peptidase domain